MRLPAAFLCAAAVLPVRADSLGEVRNAVRRLAATQPVRATLTIEQKVSSAGKFANDNTARIASAEVSHDASGVSITIPQALLDQLSYEAKTRNKRSTTQDAINTFRPDTVIQALNYRDIFLTMLDGATLKEEKRVTFRGHPARLLVIKLVPAEEKKEGRIQLGTVKSEDQLNLWVDEQFIPLAADRTQKATAGFMFVHGTFESQTSFLFGVSRDRLVLARVESKDTGSGLGQKVDKHSVQTLVLH